MMPDDYFQKRRWALAEMERQVESRTKYIPYDDAHVADDFPVDRPAPDTDYIDTFYAERFSVDPPPPDDD